MERNVGIAGGLSPAGGLVTAGGTGGGNGGGPPAGGMDPVGCGETGGNEPSVVVADGDCVVPGAVFVALTAAALGLG